MRDSLGAGCYEHRKYLALRCAVIKEIGLTGMVLLLGACSLAEPPFIYANPIVTVTKDQDYLHRTGLVSVCYHDPDLEQARALALATCAEYGLKGMERSILRDQCKLTAPHKVTFRCYDPQMRFASGAWVIPLNAVDVKKWREEQVQITGKSSAEIYAGPTIAIPDIDGVVNRIDVDVPMKIDQ